MQMLTSEKPSYDAIVERWYKVILIWAYHKVGNQQIAEDITQDTFLRAYTNYEKLTHGDIRNWIFKLARCVLIDYYRKSHTCKSCSLEAQEMDVCYEPELDKRIDIDAILASLKPLEAQAIQLYYEERYTLEEARLILDVPYYVFKYATYAGRKHFQEAYKKGIPA